MKYNNAPDPKVRGVAISIVRLENPCHCEERSDAAIRTKFQIILPLRERETNGLVSIFVS